MTRFPLIAVDVGNARTKLGWFRDAGDDGLPEPTAMLRIDNAADGFDCLGPWLASVDAKAASWSIGSVNRPVATRLVDWLREHRPDDSVTLLSAVDLPLRVALARPDMVGVDRLLDAVAANRLRASGRPAAVVDVGTAITVDLLAADGTFRGGAILPGIAMSARALHEFTDLLPLVDTTDLAAAPPPVGTSTDEAMQSGLFWGAVGAIRELVRQMTATLPSPPDARDHAAEPEIFLTGGAGPAVARLLGPTARHVPHLTLAGIALSAQSLKAL